MAGTRPAVMARASIFDRATATRPRVCAASARPVSSSRPPAATAPSPNASAWGARVGDSSEGSAAAAWAGDPGGYGGGIPYGVAGGYGGGASYGGEETYAGSSTATQVGSYGGTYRSETPLAATFAEPPLAPSPGSGYDTSNRYAYAASDDVPYAARIVSVNRAARRNCDCEPRTHADPMIYRYGVGTAY